MKTHLKMTAAVCLSLGMASVVQADQGISTADLLTYCQGKDGEFVTCEIYGQAVFDTYLAMSANQPATQTICVKQPAPSRKDVIQAYVDWAKADPAVAEQPAAQTILRFLGQRFPC
jgi:hypothetical protein